MTEAQRLGHVSLSVTCMQTYATEQNGQHSLAFTQVTPAAQDVKKAGTPKQENTKQE